MSPVITRPEQLTAVAGELAGIGSQMTAQNAAAAIHEMFVNTFGTGARSYAATEAAGVVAAT